MELGRERAAPFPHFPESIDFIVSHLLAPAAVPDQIHVRFVPMSRVSGSAIVDSLDSKEMREARLVGCALATAGSTAGTDAAAAAAAANAIVL